MLQDRLLLKDRFDSVRRLASGPNSLQGSLALTVAGLLLVAILVLAFSAVGLLRKQAEQQALVRTQLAGVAAREELRRVEEDAPDLGAIARGATRRWCGCCARWQPGAARSSSSDATASTAGLSACAVTRRAPSVVLASTRPGAATGPRCSNAVSEQGEHFMFAPPEVARGLIGATAQVPNLVETRVVVLQLPRRPAGGKADRAPPAIEVRLRAPVEMAGRRGPGAQVRALDGTHDGRARRRAH